MSKTAIEVITSVQRRRRWSAAEKERLVAASLEPGSGVSAVAREAEIHPSQLYGGRRQLCARPQAAADFAAGRVTAGPPASAERAAGTIEGEVPKRSPARTTRPVGPAVLRAR